MPGRHRDWPTIRSRMFYLKSRLVVEFHYTQQKSTPKVTNMRCRRSVSPPLACIVKCWFHTHTRVYVRSKRSNGARKPDLEVARSISAPSGIALPHQKYPATSMKNKAILVSTLLQYQQFNQRAHQDTSNKGRIIQQ